MNFPLLPSIESGTPMLAAACTGLARLRNQRGVTMIELLVVIAIAAILAAVAVPGFQGIMRDVRQKSAVNLLIADLNLARGDAIKRNAGVLVCARNAAGTDCSATANWQAGWVVCVQQGGTTSCAATSATSPNPFVVRPALASDLTLVKAGTSASTDPVRFAGNSSGTSATLTVGGTWSGAVAQVVSVSATGNITK